MIKEIAKVFLTVRREKIERVLDIYFMCLFNEQKTINFCDRVVILIINPIPYGIYLMEYT